MKRNKWFGWALAAIMTGASFTACTNETEEVFAQSNEIKLTSAITPASRVVNQLLQSTQIVENQEVGVTITGAKTSHNNMAWLTGSNGELTNTSNSPLYWGTGNVDITAYHPFNEEWDELSEYEFIVELDQSSENAYLNSDLLYAKNENVEKTGEAIPLNFTHKMSKINVSLIHEDGTTAMTNATISICGVQTNVNINMETGELTSIYGDKTEIIAGTGTEVSAIIAPQTVNENTKFIKVIHNGKTFYYTLNGAKEFVSGKAYNYSLTVKENSELILGPGSNGNITDWDSENNSTTGDANEEETGNTPAAGTVVIENYALSEALFEMYPNDVTMNNGYAVMDEDFANSFTELNFDGYSNKNNITTLEGIEHFKNLTKLNCESMHSLVTCDVTQNTNLEEVHLENSSIQALDFSKCTSIRHLYLNGNSQLSSLTLTNCTQLYSLQIEDAALNSLDIPNKAGIGALLYGGTNLTFDLSEFTNLTNLSCNSKELDNLTSIDVVKTQLTRLTCSNNNLTGDLDVSGFTNLQDFDCSNNQITSLTLPQTLTNLECQNNQIMSLLNLPQGIKSLNCQNNNISSLDISTYSGLTDWYCGNQTSTNNNESITIQVTVNSTQQSAYNNGLKEWGNENINLIPAE